MKFIIYIATWFSFYPCLWVLGNEAFLAYHLRRVEDDGSLRRMLLFFEEYGEQSHSGDALLETMDELASSIGIPTVHCLNDVAESTAHDNDPKVRGDYELFDFFSLVLSRQRCVHLPSLLLLR